MSPPAVAVPALPEIQALVGNSIAALNTIYNLADTGFQIVATEPAERVEGIFNQIINYMLVVFDDYATALAGLSFYVDQDVDLLVNSVNTALGTLELNVIDILGEQILDGIDNVSNVWSLLNAQIFAEANRTNAKIFDIERTLDNSIRATEAVLTFSTDAARDLIVDFVRDQGIETRNTLTPLIGDVTTTLLDALKTIPEDTAQFLFDLFFEDSNP